MLNDTFIQFLRNAQAKSGLSQNGFAVRIGMTPEQYCRMLKGENNVMTARIEKIAAILGYATELSFRERSQQD